MERNVRSLLMYRGEAIFWSTAIAVPLWCPGVQGGVHEYRSQKIKKCMHHRVSLSMSQWFKGPIYKWLLGSVSHNVIEPKTKGVKKSRHQGDKKTTLKGDDQTMSPGEQYPCIHMLRSPGTQESIIQGCKSSRGEEVDMPTTWSLRDNKTEFQQTETSMSRGVKKRMKSQ